ncbi:MAG: DUF6473 family protein [Paracoccaceae bacterium]
MAYEHLGEGALDYYPCRYGKSKLLFRGPRKKLDKPYVALLGGSEIYGKFVEQPMPEMLEGLIDRPVVNLGCVNAGTDLVVSDDTVMEICRNAAVTVIQITGAQNMSNRFYSVHPRRNDRFLKASNLLSTIFRDVDFTEFHFTRHLLSDLSERSPEKFAMVQQELKDAWVARMRTMMAKIGGKFVLLWMSDRTPEDACDDWSSRDPLFVDRAMLDAIADQTAGLVEVVAIREEIEAGYDRMVHTQLEELAAREMLGPVVQEAAAHALQGALSPLI